MKIFDNVTQTVGGTPLVRLNRLAEGLKAEVLVKLESRNPLGSVKDRIGVAMIEAAEKSGELKPGATIVEPTSSCRVGQVHFFSSVFTSPRNVFSA